MILSLLTVAKIILTVKMLTVFSVAVLLIAIFVVSADALRSCIPAPNRVYTVECLMKYPPFYQPPNERKGTRLCSRKYKALVTEGQLPSVMCDDPSKEKPYLMCGFSPNKQEKQEQNVMIYGQNASWCRGSVGGEPAWDDATDVTCTPNKVLFLWCNSTSSHPEFSILENWMCSPSGKFLPIDSGNMSSGIMCREPGVGLNKDVCRWINKDGKVISVSKGDKEIDDPRCRVYDACSLPVNWEPEHTTPGTVVSDTTPGTVSSDTTPGTVASDINARHCRIRIQRQTLSHQIQRQALLHQIQRQALSHQIQRQALSHQIQRQALSH